ncbi:hypothetical protein THAOC_11768 [Thalassiosira oceanica]|uniref:Uncharacterized protein n=1 Tax=Thalassiosira oceanica TaxID=159749 RepID=K0SLS9_THAOC|nr:hypothetical protein THAOC_11768 [Thalassiosira oceanica]|eukprot:EJK67233.1 hypothetical protein THAOC_11768 [Thalassiosira oceanica]
MLIEIPVNFADRRSGWHMSFGFQCRIEGVSIKIRKKIGRMICIFDLPTHPFALRLNGGRSPLSSSLALALMGTDVAALAARLLFRSFVSGLSQTRSPIQCLAFGADCRRLRPRRTNPICMPPKRVEASRAIIVVLVLLIRSRACAVSAVPCRGTRHALAAACAVAVERLREPALLGWSRFLEEGLLPTSSGSPVAE